MADIAIKAYISLENKFLSEKVRENVKNGIFKKILNSVNYRYFYRAYYAKD